MEGIAGPPKKAPLMPFSEGAGSPEDVNALPLRRVELWCAKGPGWVPVRLRRC